MKPTLSCTPSSCQAAAYYWYRSREDRARGAFYTEIIAMNDMNNIGGDGQSLPWDDTEDEDDLVVGFPMAKPTLTAAAPAVSATAAWPEGPTMDGDATDASDPSHPAEATNVATPSSSDA